MPDSPGWYWCILEKRVAAVEVFYDESRRGEAKWFMRFPGSAGDIEVLVQKARWERIPDDLIPRPWGAA